MKIDTSTILSDKIVIDHVIIRAPEISYEKTLRNSNLKQLLANIESFTGSGSDAAVEEAPTVEEESPASRKQVVIKKLLIEDGTIYVGALGVGQTVPLPRIEMTDIGEDGEQMSIAETVDLVVTTILKSIGPAIANAPELGSAAVEALSTQGLEKVNQASEKVSDGIKGLFGK